MDGQVYWRGRSGFVTFAAFALTSGVFCFCKQCAFTISRHISLLLYFPVEVIQPDLRWPLLTVPLNALVACNLLGHYYLSCTVPPGFIDEPPQTAGKGVVWARKRKRKVRLPAGVGNGLSLDSDGVNVTAAHISQCRRCGQLRPEVSF